MAVTERMDDSHRTAWFEFCRDLTPEQTTVVRREIERRERQVAASLEAEAERLREALEQCRNTDDAYVYRIAINALAGRRWDDNGPAPASR